VAYIVNNAISEGCCGQGQCPLQSAVDAWSWTFLLWERWHCLQSCSHAAAEVQPSFLSGRVGRNSDRPSIGSPWGSDACHAPEVAYTSSGFLRRSQWQMVISQFGHRGGGWRPGHNLIQLAGHQGLCIALPDSGQQYTASVCCGQDTLLCPSWSDGLLTSLGDFVASQNKPTNWWRWIYSWMETVSDKNPTLTDTNFYVTTQTRGSWVHPQVWWLKQGSGICHLRVKAHDSLLSWFVD
jgi:hypothetical protein